MRLRFLGLLTVILFLLSLPANSQGLTTREILSGKVNILFSQDFDIMSPEVLMAKYPSAGHRPTEVYTNNKNTINVALNHTTNKARPEDLPEVRNLMESQFNRAPFTFIKSELREMNGAQFVILEFVSPASDTNIYNLMAISSLEGRLVMVTFNCTEAERKEWEPIGEKIINSITLKR